MAFCPKCGKQLADGEICSCQTVQPQQQAPVQPQAPVHQKAPAQTPEFIKAILELFKGLFKKPADAVKNFVLKSSDSFTCAFACSTFTYKCHR